jgi:hypothetical protein
MLTEAVDDFAVFEDECASVERQSIAEQELAFLSEAIAMVHTTASKDPSVAFPL